jgi:hypothetical protein
VFTKEESRVSLIGTLAALCGSLLGATAALLGTRMNLAESRATQRKIQQHQAYTQLRGEQAQFTLLFQLISDTVDKSVLYQVRATQEHMKPPRTRQSGEMVGPKVDNSSTYTSDALQLERNVERYRDELVNCAQRMFESIALIELSFAADRELDRRVANAEAMLTSTDDLLPKESFVERISWVLRSQNAEDELSDRHKKRLPYIVKATQPITDLADYLKIKAESDAQ